MSDVHTKRPIVIAGGGTGGHVFPGIAVARELRRRDPARPLLWIGARAGIEARLVPAEQIPLTLLPLGGVAGKSLAVRAKSLVQAGSAFVRCTDLFRNEHPAAVLGVGGFASGPAGAAAVLARVPLLLHEQNSVPGGTNRLLARFARTIAVSFPDTAARLASQRVVVTGNPVRAEFFAGAGGHAPGSGFGPLAVLVTGGSRGARSINRAVADALPRLAAAGTGAFHFTHQTGDADAASLAETHRAAGFASEVAAFLDDMPRRMQAADLVVCRSGASAVFEVAAAGRPSVLIPFPFASGDHQTANARSLADAGAALLIPDAELSGERLAATLLSLAADRAGLARMGAAAGALAQPTAASRIADLIEEAAR